jgi:hypothetical protein
VQRLLFITLILLSLYACKKEDQIDPAIRLTHIELKIPTDADVAQFDVVTENIIVAACTEENFLGYALSLYITVNGGHTWSSMSSPVANVETLQSIVFTDADNGALVANNKGWRTVDGGVTWSPVSEFGLQLSLLMATKEGSFLFFFEKESWFESRIFISPYGGVFVDECGTFNADYVYLERGKRSGDRVFFFPHWVCTEYQVQSLHMGSWIQENLDDIKGSCLNDVQDVTVGNGRILLTRKGQQGFELNFHDDPEKSDSFYDDPATNDLTSSAYIGNYFISVGDQLMFTNRNGTWERVYLNGNSIHYNHYYTQITNLDSKWFYLSGKNGYFAKGTIIL